MNRFIFDYFVVDNIIKYNERIGNKNDLFVGELRTLRLFEPGENVSPGPRDWFFVGWNPGFGLPVW